ncbi:MAG: hypothetical protein ACI4XS_13085 [Bacillus sp. (in: firmicutes)]
MDKEYLRKEDVCKCGGKLVLTKTKPVWVHCKDPYCDYVVMYGDFQVDRIFKTYSQSKFEKDGPNKGQYRGSPVVIHITDIKKNFRFRDEE